MDVATPEVDSVPWLRWQRKRERPTLTVQGDWTKQQQPDDDVIKSNILMTVLICLCCL